MKRLVISGLPCSAAPWEAFLGESCSSNTRIVTMREVLEKSQASDPRKLAGYIGGVLQSEAPDSVLCHGMGVPLTVLALMRLEKAGTPLWPKLTLFNGAFRHVSLSQSTPPIRIQYTPVSKMLQEVEALGGDIDWGLKPHIAQIRAMYRLVILYRLTEKLTDFLGLDFLDVFPARTRFRSPIQILASSNDPFLPQPVMEGLRRELCPERFVEFDYGHFPYSVPYERFRPYIEEFESEPGLRAV